MSKEQFDAFQARRGQHAARPVLDALVEQRPADEDAFRGTGVRSQESEVSIKDECPEGEELELHNEIIRECRRRGWVYVHSNPSKRTRQTLGTPDFIIPASGGRTLYVECKTVNGTLSKDQKNFRRGIQAQGHVYHIIRSLSSFQMVAERIEELANNKKL